MKKETFKKVAMNIAIVSILLGVAAIIVGGIQIAHEGTGWVLGVGMLGAIQGVISYMLIDTSEE